MLKKFQAFKGEFGYLRWLTKFTVPYLPRLSLIFIFHLASTFIGIGISLLSKYIIDHTTTGGNIKGAIAVYIVALLISQAIFIASSLLSVMLNEKYSFGIRKQLYEKIINSQWYNISKYHTGDLMTRLTSDAGIIADGMINVVPTVIRLILELIITFFTLFYFEPRLAIFALILGPIASGICAIFAGKMKRLQVKVQETESSYRSYLQESLSNILIVKSFTNEQDSIERLSNIRDEHFNWLYKRSKLNAISATALNMSFQIGYIVAFTFGAVQLSQNLITFGTMTLFLNLVNRIQSPIVSLAQNVPKIVSIWASAGRIIELQNIPGEIKKEDHIHNRNVGVVVDSVTFGYTNDYVLENVSLSINAGEFVGIVGESGIGKTTLVRLLMSFLDNVKGRIEYHNSFGEKELVNPGIREYVSYVPQGNTLFSGTIRENIRMGRTSASEEEIINALKLASAYNFVMELKEGLDTMIGEKGQGLSEGQAQRIAIARAVVRNAPFLILDEATSALDEKTEIEVLQGIKSLPIKPTCLLITHRLSVLKYCDREVRIKNKQLSTRNLNNSIMLE